MVASLACIRSEQSSPIARVTRSPSRPSTSRPGPGEALVQVQACGVCHTDLHYREGGINDEFPFLLGHEAAGVVESVGEGVTGLEAGDFVILNWRAVCGNCRACDRGEPWYCFATHNATQKMTLAGRHRAVARARHRRLRREDAGRGRPVHQGRPGGPRGRRRPARLRRDGRPGRGDQHRQRQPRQDRRRHRLRRRRLRLDRRGRARPAPRRSSRSTSTTGSSRPPRSWAPPTRSTARRPTRSRRSSRSAATPAVRRRRRGHRRGRPARDLEAGVLRPRPRRHGRPRRRTDAGHEDPRHPADRRLRPRRRAEVELVRRLPAQPRLPDARRPLPAGPARPRRVRHRGDRARRRGGAPSTGCTPATCCARS